MSRKEKAIDNILGLRLERKQKSQKVNIRRIPCVQQQQDAQDHYCSSSSCEAELHAIVSSASDGKYIRLVLEFALGTKVARWPITFSQILRAHANL